MPDDGRAVRDKRSSRINNSWPEAFRIAILGEMVQIQVDGFNGPIDLLLELIDRNQLDVRALSLAEVADQYWREIDSADGVEPEVLAEFITVGSKLLYIKSCAIIPSAEPPAEDLANRIEQAAGELTAMLRSTSASRTPSSCSVSSRTKAAAPTAVSRPEKACRCRRGSRA